MTSDTPDIRQLVARVENLERQNRRLRCFAFAGLALIGGLALIAGANPSQAQLAGRQGVFADVASSVIAFSRGRSMKELEVNLTLPFVPARVMNSASGPSMSISTWR